MNSIRTAAAAAGIACALFAGSAIAATASDSLGSLLITTAPPTPAIPDVILIPRSLDDTLTARISDAKTLFIRETTPQSPPRDHPEAYALCIATLERLVEERGDSIFENPQAQNFFNDRGLPALRYVYGSKLPRQIVFLSTQRLDESASYIAFKDAAGREKFQRVGDDAPCCWRSAGTQGWVEAGLERVVIAMVREDSVGRHDRIQFFHREGDHWNLARTVGSDAYGGRYVAQLLAPVEKAPLFNIIRLESSHLFENSPGEQTLKIRGFYRVQGDSIRLVRDLMGDSYFGLPTWVMECMSRGRLDWARLFVPDSALLRRLAGLPWDRARSGWRFESFSAFHDTLVASHPAIGRLTLYSARVGNMDHLADFKFVSAAVSGKKSPKPAVGRAPRKGKGRGR